MSEITSINSNLIQIGGNLLQVITDTPTPALPPYTIRLKFTEGVTPTFSKGTATQVSSSPNIWDLTYDNADWTCLLSGQTDLLEVIGGNTSNVTTMTGIFDSCTSLTTVPLFDTSNVTTINSMFYGCTNVQSGALALYQQASTQTNPPSKHNYTFRNCGSNTTTGAAELAQIPSNWK